MNGSQYDVEHPGRRLGVRREEPPAAVPPPAPASSGQLAAGEVRRSLPRGPRRGYRQAIDSLIPSSTPSSRASRSGWKEEKVARWCVNPATAAAATDLAGLGLLARWRRWPARAQAPCRLSAWGWRCWPCSRHRQPAARRNRRMAPRGHHAANSGGCGAPVVPLVLWPI